MGVLNHDFLHPLYDKNRNEILLVDFNGFIKNFTEHIVISMLLLKDKWIKLYPKLDRYDGVTDERIYDDTMLYSPEEYLLKLSDNARNIEDIRKDIDEVKRTNVLQYQQLTVFEFTLSSLLAEKFIHQCYFIKTEEFTIDEVHYISAVFQEHIQKIQIITIDNIQEAIDEFKPTTCFINDFDVIDNVKDTHKDILFILRNSLNNIHLSKDNIFQHKHEFIDKIEKINSEKKIYVGTMFVFKDDNIKISEPEG